jgi:hypothetical protein
MGGLRTETAAKPHLHLYLHLRQPISFSLSSINASSLRENTQNQNKSPSGNQTPQKAKTARQRRGMNPCLPLTGTSFCSFTIPIGSRCLMAQQHNRRQIFLQRQRSWMQSSRFKTTQRPLPDFKSVLSTLLTPNSIFYVSLYFWGNPANAIPTYRPKFLSPSFDICSN